MVNTIIWSSVGILVLALLIGLGVGIIRGLKRSAVHIAFLLASVIVAFLLTKTITKAILGITLPIDNGKYTISEYIIFVISKKFDISAFDSASSFVTNLPNAIVAPVMFLALTIVVYLLFDIAYLITARLAFGKKKEEFKEKKAYRAFGGLVGLFEGLLIVILMFGPISSLTGTYKELTTATSISAEVPIGGLKTVSQHANEILPSKLNEAILTWDKSVCGKLPKVFGLNNALFDNLSSFKVKGEKISLRNEIRHVAYAYDDFVEVYNYAKKGEYTKIKMIYLRTSLDTLLDGNFFEVVVCDSIDKIVSDYENMKTKLPFTPPQIMDEIVGEISGTFKQKGFDAARYLKHDIMQVLNTFDVVFSNDLITKYNAIPDKNDFIQIMEFVSANNSAVGNAARKIVSLNLVEDSFNVFVNKASTAIEKTFEGKEFEVKLNSAIENKSETVDALLNVVDSVIDLNNDINIADILKTTDIVETLTSVESISKTMTKIGTAFDKVRNLEILKHPSQEEGGQTIYTFDNILKNYGVDLLGDEVYLTLDETQKTTLDSYSKFFNFIAGPIDAAKTLGLTDFGKEGVTFDSVLDRILLGLKINDTQLLTRVVMPFYQLNAMNLRGLVFDKVVENLRTNVDILSLDELVTLNDYHTWVEEFNNLGDTLNLLNTGKIEGGLSEIEGYDNTYIKYLLTADADLEKVMNAMLDYERLSGVLNNVFSSKMFAGLTRDVFDILDNKVREMTNTSGVIFESDLTNLEATKENTIQTIEGILKTVLSNQELQISDFGKVLNLLKVNASNGGQKNGVFNNIFMNVIWYLTGDDLTTEQIYKNYIPQTGETTPNANAEDIKAYLNITDYYADNVDYEVLLQEAEKAVDLIKKIKENVSFEITPENSISNMVSGLEASLADMTEVEKVKTLNNLETMLNNKNETLLTDDFGVDERAALDVAINEKFGSDSEVSQALKSLLKI